MVESVGAGGLEVPHILSITLYSYIFCISRVVNGRGISHILSSYFLKLSLNIDSTTLLYHFFKQKLEGVPPRGQPLKKV